MKNASTMTKSGKMNDTSTVTQRQEPAPHNDSTEQKPEHSARKERRHKRAEDNNIKLSKKEARRLYKAWGAEKNFPQDRYEDL